jgi:hypothetical protein
VATTSGPPTVVSGLSVMPSVRTSTADVPTASSTGTIVSRPRTRSRYSRHHERRHQQQRHDRELGTVGRDVLEQADAHDREATGGGRRHRRQQRCVARFGDRGLDPVEHDRTLLERRRAHLEQHLRGVAVVGDQQLLQRRRRDPVRLQHVEPGGRQRRRSGTSASQPTVVARLDASASSTLSPSERSTRSNTNAPIWSVKTPLSGALDGLDEHAEGRGEPGLVLERAGVADRRTRRFGPVDRVALDLRPPSSDSPSTGIATATATSGTPSLVAGCRACRPWPPPSRARAAVVLGERRSRAPIIGGGHDDAGDEERDDADRQQHAEVLHHRHLRDLDREERDHRGDGRHQQRRAEVVHRLAERVGIAVDRALLLDAVLHLDRELDAEADEDRQAGDGDERQHGAGEAERTEPPHDADDHAGERQQPPPHLERDDRMTTITPTAMPPSVSMPPCR